MLDFQIVLLQFLFVNINDLCESLKNTIDSFLMKFSQKSENINLLAEILFEIIILIILDETSVLNSIMVRRFIENENGKIEKINFHLNRIWAENSLKFFIINYFSIKNCFKYEEFEIFGKKVFEEKNIIDLMIEKVI